MKQLAYHFSGSYFMQLAIATAAAARTVVQSSAARLDSETCRAADIMLPTIVENLAYDYADMALHTAASHVLDALVAHASSDELLNIADEVGQSACRLLGTKWGFKLLTRILDRLVRFASPSADPASLRPA